MIKTVTTELGGRTITFETGKMAKQANGSVVVSSGDIKVLVTVVADRRLSASTPSRDYLAGTEFLNQRPVFGDIFFLQVFDQVPTLADQLEQTAAGVVVLGVGLEVLGQVENALGKQSDLHFARAGVGLVRLEFFNDCLRLLGCLCHGHLLLLPAKRFPSASLESGW